MYMFVYLGCVVVEIKLKIVTRLLGPYLLNILSFVLSFVLSEKHKFVFIKQLKLNLIKLQRKLSLWQLSKYLLYVNAR